MNEVYFWSVLTALTSKMSSGTHLECWHLVGLDVKPRIPALIQRPIVWLLLDNML